MSKKVLTDYHKQFIAENYRTLGPQGCADALGVKYGTVDCCLYCITPIVIYG